MRGVGRCGAVGRAAPGALRARRLDQGARAADRVESQHGPGGVARVGAAEVCRARRRGRSSIRSRTRSTVLLKRDPAMPGQRVRELIAPLGFEGGKTIVDDYLREVRPLFVDAADLSAHGLSAGRDLPVRSVGTASARSRSVTARRAAAWVVVACLGYSRAGAGAVIFSKQTPDLLFGIRRCLWSLGALPQTLVWDRQSGLHAAGGRPTAEFAAFCGAAAGRLALLRPRATRRPRASSSACRTSWRRSFEPGRLLRQRARLPAAARRLVRRPRERADAQDAARPARSTG